MQAGLGVVGTPAHGHEAYRGRLAIPYYTPTGVIYMKFRCLKGHDCKAADCRKYLNLSEGTHVYNVEAFGFGGDEVGICEGELDALASTYRLQVPAVGIPGANAWQEWYWRLFDGYERVWIFGDGDDAGRGFAAQVNDDLTNGIVVPVPNGMDVSSWLLAAGPEGIQEVLDELR